MSVVALMTWAAIVCAVAYACWHAADGVIAAIDCLTRFEKK